MESHVAQLLHLQGVGEQLDLAGAPDPSVSISNSNSNSISNSNSNSISISTTPDGIKKRHSDKVVLLRNDLVPHVLHRVRGGEGYTNRCRPERIEHYS